MYKRQQQQVSIALDPAVALYLQCESALARQGFVERNHLASQGLQVDRLSVRLRQTVFRFGEEQHVGHHPGEPLEFFEMLAGKTGKEPVEALEQSIKVLTPVLEVKSRRVGGATYQVPVEVPSRRARTLAVRWLVEFARGRREKSMAERLANELADAGQQQGDAYKRKDDIYRMAQANKAFAHYRW